MSTARKIPEGLHLVVAPRIFAAWKSIERGADELDAFAEFGAEPEQLREQWQHVARVSIAATLLHLERAGWIFRDPNAATPDVRTPPPGIEHG